MSSYEGILSQIAAVPKGFEGRDRMIQWLNDHAVVGVARDHYGQIELFLAGSELHPRTKTLRDAIQYHIWHRECDSSLSANRLLFPAFGHFDSIAAFIATELLREGADDDLPRAVAATEPILELAIKRLHLSESALLGLAGELLILDAMARRVDAACARQLLQSWNGWRRSIRDISWKSTGVEIKTTTGAFSSHIVQGTHQVEPSRGDGTAPDEDRLLLVSVGLQRSAPSANSFTVPGLTQRLVDWLDTTGHQEYINDFLSRVAEYGAESGLGYHHSSMSSDAPFATTFTPAFVRGYDMGDPAIQIIRRDDVVSHHHVDASSLSFRIDLPATVSLGNPVDGLHRIAESVLGFQQ